VNTTKEMEFNFHTKESAPRGSKGLLEGIEKQFGFVPIIFRYTAEAPAVLKAMVALMDLVSQTSFTPAQQQIAALAVSTENDCINCMTGHCYLGKMHEANDQTLETLFTHLDVDIEDPKDRALSKFARSVAKNRGLQTQEDVEAFLAAGFTKEQVFEIMLIVGYKTLTNYTNHLTDSPADEELAVAFKA
jgi:uncharacterized peroxidase-related enzyme